MRSKSVVFTIDCEIVVRLIVFMIERWPLLSHRVGRVPKARVDRIGDDTVEDGSRDRRVIGERDAAHVGVERAATDSA